MNFNAQNYEEHQKDYFNQKFFFQKNISLFFIYELKRKYLSIFK